MNNVSVRTILKVLVVSAAFIGLLWIAYFTRRELVWFGTAFFLAVALNPSVQWLSDKLFKGRRWLSTTVVFLLVLLLLSFIVVSLVPPLINQTQSLVKHGPSDLAQWQNSNSAFGQFVKRYDLTSKLANQQSAILSDISRVGGSVINVLGFVFNSLIAGISILMLTLFMILEGPMWIDACWKMYPKNRRAHDQHLMTQMYEAVTGYVLGKLITSLIVAVATAVILMIVGVPYSIPLGLLVGLFDLLPLVGATIGAVIVIAVSLFAGSVGAAVVMTLFFIIYQQVENHVLQPLIFGKSVQMSPLLVLMTVFMGAALGGVIGAIVAIPVAASLQILLLDYLRETGRITK